MNGPLVEAPIDIHISFPVLEIASDFWVDLLLNLVLRETASEGYCVLSRSELISLSRRKTWPEKRTMHAFLQKAINTLSKIQNWQSMSLFSTSFYWQRWQIAWARHTEDDYYISSGAHVHELSVPYQEGGSQKTERQCENETIYGISKWAAHRYEAAGLLCIRIFV